MRANQTRYGRYGPLVPVSAKKKTLCANFSRLFAKFSRSFRKFSRSFRKFRKFSDVFGYVRMRSDAFGCLVTEKKTPKTRNENFEKSTNFYEVFKEIRKDRARHAPPHQSKKILKNEVCLKWKFRLWRLILSKNHQNRSYPRGVNVRSKFFDFTFLFFFEDTGSAA